MLLRMETKTNYSLTEYIQASPSRKFIAPILLSLLIFEHWRHYGLQNPSLAGSWLLNFWPILIVLGLSVLDGIIRYYRKSPMIPLKDDARYKKCSQLNLYLFFSWLAVSAVSRIFLSSSIDRFVALYVGPAVALLLFGNLLIYFINMKRVSKKLLILLLLVLITSPSYADLVVERTGNIPSTSTTEDDFQGIVVGDKLVLTSEKENLLEITINGVLFPLFGKKSAEIDISDFPPGSEVSIVTDKNIYKGYLE